jgi:glyoxylase-like metal-dependent hydrolase (beta-lactamase superfamily II)
MAAVGAPLERVRVGDIKVTWIPDGTGAFKGSAFLPPSTDEEWKERHSDDIDELGRMVVSLGGMLVQTPDNIVLIDTGVGNHKLELPIGYSGGGEFLKSLAKAGVTPEQIDTVAFTHMHADHVGWISEGVGDSYRLRYPNARFAMHPGEWSFWEGKDDHVGMRLESMEKPMREKLDLVGDGGTIVRGVTLVHTPGHTPGHASIVVESQGERVYVLGDPIHSSAQISESSWACFADADAAVARSTREALIRELQKGGTITAGTHFANSVFGRVVPVQGKPHWVIGAPAESGA